MWLLANDQFLYGFRWGMGFFLSAAIAYVAYLFAKLVWETSTDLAIYLFSRLIAWCADEPPVMNKTQSQALFKE